MTKAKTASEVIGLAKPLFDAVTGDILVVKKRLPKKGKRGTPTDVELHVNPFSIGAGVVGVGLALWLAQMRVGVTAAHYGRWRWPDGKFASKDIIVQDALSVPDGDPPSRQIVFDIPKPVYDSSVESWLSHSLDLASWFLQTHEVASWVYMGTKNTTGLKERKGFLNDGIGTDTDSGSIGPIDSSGRFSVWKLLTDPWGIFPW